MIGRSEHIHRTWLGARKFPLGKALAVNQIRVQKDVILVVYSAPISKARVVKKNLC